MKLKKLPLILVIAALVFQFIVFSVRAETSAVVRVTPEYVNQMDVGSIFAVQIIVENGVQISAVQVYIQYSPYALNVLKVEQGAYLSNAGPTLLALNDSIVKENVLTEESTGEIRYAEALTGNNYANGNGLICTVTFEVTSSESSTLHFMVYNHDGAEGTYFISAHDTQAYPYVQSVEIVPQLQDGQYGPRNPLNPGDTEQSIATVKTSTIMPLAILSIAITFVAATRIARKRN